MEPFIILPQPEQFNYAADVWRPAYQQFILVALCNDVNHSANYMDKSQPLRGYALNSQNSTKSQFHGQLQKNSKIDPSSRAGPEYLATNSFPLSYPVFPLSPTDWLTQLYCQQQHGYRVRYELDLKERLHKSLGKKKSSNRATTFAIAETIDFRLNAYNNVNPWKIVNKEHKTYSQNLEGLHEEIKDFYSYILPTAEEKAIRECVIDRVTKVIKQIWPNAEIDVFGSFTTNLFLPTSDIDMAVNLKQVDDSQPLWTMESALRRSSIASEILVLDRAVVPIVKFKDVETDVRVDIGLNVGGNKNTGTRSADLIKGFIKEFPLLPYLVVVLKQFLLQRELNEVWRGGLSSYSLTLMCVRFLQDHVHGRLSETNLGKLLIEFFEFYCRQFNYQSLCIRVKDGGAFIPKTNAFSERGGAQVAYLAIEDPFNSENDIARRSYRFLDVKGHFEAAYQALSHNTLPNHPSHSLYRDVSLLSRIICVSREVQQYRHWIKENFFQGHKKRANFVETHIVKSAPKSLPVDLEKHEHSRELAKESQSPLCQESGTPMPGTKEAHDKTSKRSSRLPSKEEIREARSQSLHTRSNAILDESAAIPMRSPQKEMAHLKTTTKSCNVVIGTTESSSNQMPLQNGHAYEKSKVMHHRNNSSHGQLFYRPNVSSSSSTSSSLPSPFHEPRQCDVKPM